MTGYSLYTVFSCSCCGHKFRGIYAKINEGYHSLIRMISIDWSRVDVTSCPYCYSDVWGSHNSWGNVSWPEVCATCGRDLPTGEPTSDEAVVR